MRHLFSWIAACFAAMVPAQTWTLYPATVPIRATAWDLARERLLLVGTDSQQRVYEWSAQGAQERPGELAGVRTIGWMTYDRVGRRALALSSEQFWVGSWRRGEWLFARSGDTVTGLFRAMAYDELRQRLVLLTSTGLAEWDGQRWRNLGSFGVGEDEPLAFAYDPRSQRCLLYGRSSPGQQAATWSWDGFAWTVVGAAPAGARAGAGMAFDRSLQRMVLFGGDAVATDTWAWDGSTWLQVPSSQTPDPALQCVLHDDGVGVTMVQPASGKIWQLRGGQWRFAAELPRTPVSRNNTAFAYDPVRGQIVGFGGDQGGINVPTDQTLLWDRGWLRCAPATNPPLRHSAQLAWSSANQQTLLFGGVFAGTAVRGDTWLWDGSDWHLQATATSPAPRYDAVMAPDPLGGVMLFGGRDANTYFDDHWHWDGSAWHLLALSQRPGMRSRASHAYDPVRQQVVLQGGRNAVQLFVDTWTWDGFVWQPRQTTVEPNVTVAAAFRPATQRVVVAGTIAAFEWTGSDWQPSQGMAVPGLFLNWRYAVDLRRGEFLSMSPGRVDWSISYPATVEAYGNACALGPAPILAAISRPGIDTQFAMELADSSVAAPMFLVLGLIAQSHALGSGCRSLVALELDTLLTFGNAGGIARFALPIPLDRSLLGVQLTAQGAVFDPVRSPLGSVLLTAGLRFSIGE